MIAEPFVLSDELFSARVSRRRMRASLGWGSMFATLVFLAMSGFAAFQALGLGAEANTFEVAAPFLGAAMLCATLAVYAWNCLPWQAQNHASREDGVAQLSETGWLAFEQAYSLAKQVQREVQPVHVLLGAFVSNDGAMVLARLGLSFERLHEPSAEWIRQGASAVGAPSTSAAVQAVFASACELARAADKRCGAIELIRACLQVEPTLAQFLERAGGNTEHVEAVSRWLAVQAALKQEHDQFVRLAALKPDTDLNRTMTARATGVLNALSEDLTRLAKQGYIAPVVPREVAWNACVRAWESGARGLVLVGPEGVGKTAFLEGLARRMVEERVPSAIFDRRLVSIHAQALVTGADAGEVSERVLQLAKEVAESGNVLLCVEGIEALVGAGYGGTHDVLDLLSNEVERYGLFLLATTTPEAWTTHIERRVFGKRATKVELSLPEKTVAEAILLTHAGALEYTHGVFFTYGAIELALRVGFANTQTLALPGNALEWLREAAAATRAQRGPQAMVDVAEVGRIIEEKTGIPASFANEEETERVLQLEDRLSKRVVGQEDAVRAVAQAMRRARAEVRDGSRPIASFLFLGPTGVGKTELAKGLAAEYFGAADRLIRVDCSEYQTTSSIERLIGQTRDERGGVLTEAIRRKPYALVLLDEIEKAHPDVLTLFLQVLDDGRITDGNGRTIDCTHSIVIATSNAASKYIQQRVHEGAAHEILKRELMERELLSVFRPEFLNRFDGVEVFQPLTLQDVEKIAWLLLRGFEQRLHEKGIAFQADDAAVEALAKRGYDPEFGARPLRRLLQDTIESQMADLVLRKQVKRGDTVYVRANGQLEVGS